MMTVIRLYLVGGLFTVLAAVWAGHPRNVKTWPIVFGGFLLILAAWPVVWIRVYHLLKEDDQ